MIAHRRVLRVLDRAGLRLPGEERPPAGIGSRAVGPRRVDPPRSRDQLVERLRVLERQRRQVGRDLDRELPPPHRPVPLLLHVEQPRGVPHVHDRGARPAHRVERRLHHPVHVAVGAHEVARDADPRARERAGVERRRVVGGRAALAFSRRLVRRVHAGHHAERHGHVGHVARHRPAGVEAERQRDDAVAAHQPVRRLEPDDAVGGGGAANRAAGVGAEAELRVARRDGHAGAARRSGRRARKVVRIERLAAERAVRAARGELGEVHLRQDDGARLAQPLHHEGVVGRQRSLEQHRRARRRQVGGVVVVLEHDRDAVER